MIKAATKVLAAVVGVVFVVSARGTHLLIEYRQLTYMNAADVARELRRRFPPPPTVPSGAVAVGEDDAINNLPVMHADSDERTNTVVIDGWAEWQKEAVELVDQMEAEARAAVVVATTRPATQPALVATIAFRRLTKLKASEVANDLNTRFNPPRPARGSTRPATTGPAAPVFLAQADAANNILVVHAPRDLQTQALELIDRLEAGETADTRPRE
jgi:type II secretory pathway component GspD/PulD (secretin)